MDRRVGATEFLSDVLTALCVSWTHQHEWMHGCNFSPLRASLDFSDKQHKLSVPHGNTYTWLLHSAAHIKNCVRNYFCFVVSEDTHTHTQAEGCRNQSRNTVLSLCPMTPQTSSNVRCHTWKVDRVFPSSGRAAVSPAGCSDDRWRTDNRAACTFPAHWLSAIDWFCLLSDKHILAPVYRTSVHTFANVVLILLVYTWCSVELFLLLLCVKITDSKSCFIQHLEILLFGLDVGPKLGQCCWL